MTGFALLFAGLGIVVLAIVLGVFFFKGLILMILLLFGITLILFSIIIFDIDGGNI